MTEDKIEAIGAHFSCILENRKNSPPGNYGYESARASLYSLLKSMKVQRVHIPNYICEAIPDVILKAGCSTVKYPINSDFEIDGQIDLQPGDLILLVNYFGLTQNSIVNQLSSLPRERVIVDCSQAYFQKSFHCLASIYSARKFIPVADGGFIDTTWVLESEAADDNISIDRHQYLLRRVIGEPELSRQLYLQAEDSLKNVNRRSISDFSRKIIETADFEFITTKRRDNFLKLQKLEDINRLGFTLENQVPLCYPLMIEKGHLLREKLTKNRIFTPKYWPNITALNAFEKKLLQDVVYLPIDHRQGDNQINRIIDVVMDHI